MIIYTVRYDFVVKTNRSLEIATDDYNKRYDFVVNVNRSPEIVADDRLNSIYNFVANRNLEMVAVFY